MPEMPVKSSIHLVFNEFLPLAIASYILFLFASILQHQPDLASICIVSKQKNLKELPFWRSGGLEFRAPIWHPVLHTL